MPPPAAGDLRIPRSLDLNTVILLASVGASFWAQWATFRDRSDSQALLISATNVHLAATDAEVSEIKASLAETRQRIQDVIEVYRDLRK